MGWSRPVTLDVEFQDYREHFEFAAPANFKEFIEEISELVNIEVSNLKICYRFFYFGSDKKERSFATQRSYSAALDNAIENRLVVCIINRSITTGLITTESGTENPSLQDSPRSRSSLHSLGGTDIVINSEIGSRKSSTATLPTAMRIPNSGPQRARIEMLAQPQQADQPIPIHEPDSDEEEEKKDVIDIRGLVHTPSGSQEQYEETKTPVQTIPESPYLLKFESNTVLVIDVVTKECNALEARSRTSAIKADFKGCSYVFFSERRVFITGGLLHPSKNTSISSNACYEFNLSTGIFTLCNNVTMNQGRSYHCTYYLHGAVYTFGGFENTSVEQYSKTANKWRMIKGELPFPSRAHNYQCAFWQKCFYITAMNYHKIAKFDPSTVEFSKINFCVS